MKFDFIVGNPPYQTKTDASYKNGTPIWHKFVEVLVDKMAPDGYMSLVHPSGWRNAGGKFEKTKNLLLSYDMQYLEMHDINDGKRVFGAGTRYDWYVLKNAPYAGSTTVVDDEGITSVRDLRSLPFIPSRKAEQFRELLATEHTTGLMFSRSSYGSDRANMSPVIIHSESAYESRRKHMSPTFISDCNYYGHSVNMSKEQKGEFIHPCVMNVGKGDKITKLYYSNTTGNGHFGIPKLIFGRFGTGIHLDLTGEYGMCQVVAGIPIGDNDPYLMKQAMQSPEFIELMRAADVGGLGTIYNHRVLALLKADFWKKFV